MSKIPSQESVFPNEYKTFCFIKAGTYTSTYDPVPFKGDTVIVNDVWIDRESIIMPV